MLKLYSYITVLFLALTLVPASAGANQSLVLEKTFSENINRSLHYYVDEKNELSTDTILNTPKEFQKVESENLPLSDVKLQTIWAKLPIQNWSNKNEKYYISFFPPYLGNIEIYKKEDGKLNLISKTGSLINQNFQELSSDLSAPIDIDPGTSDFIIKITSIGAGLSVNLQDEKTFKRSKAIDEIIFSFIIGALMMLALYHIFIYFTSKENIYFYYVCYTFSMILFQFGMTGFNRYLLPPTVLGFPFGYLGSLLAGNLLIISTSLFTYKLLELNTKNWKYKYPLPCIAFLAVLATATLLLTESATSIIFTRGLGALVIITSISTATVMSFRKNPTARFYLLSWSPILLGTIVLILTLSGTIKESPATTWILPFGSIAESLLLAFAIGNRLQKMTKEKIQEQKMKLKAYDQLKDNFEKMKARDTIIKTYVSPTILTELALGKSPIDYPPQHISRTILFTDLRNYTGLTEKISSEKAYSYLNHYFTTLNESIFKHNGEVDKLIGDAIMATFNNADNSLKAYAEFRANFNLINRSRIKKGLRPIYFGTGISFGEVLSANFGSLHKLDRTIVGDAVNIASRCESLTKKYGVNLVATPEFISKLDSTDLVRPLDLPTLRGKKGQQLVHEIFLDNPQDVIDYKMTTKKPLEEHITLRENGQYEDALLIVEELIKNCPRHKYVRNKIMDTSLYIIKESILEELKNKDRVNHGKTAA